MDQYNSKELRALVMVMRYTGLRISDAVVLNHTQLVPRESGPGSAIKIMSMQKTDDWVRIPTRSRQFVMAVSRSQLPV